jgi:plastocyanin
VAASRMDARTASRGPAGRTWGWFAALFVLAAAIALLGPAAASAAGGCTAGPTSGTQTTYKCNVPTGTIGRYEVKQWYPIGVPTPGVTGHITHMETDIIDAQTGQPVPIARLMLHHIVFLNLRRQDSTCAGQGFTGFDGRQSFGRYAPQRFYAAGEERAKLAMPPGYGYKTDAGDDWALAVMVMNHRSASDNALIHYEMTVDTDPSLQSVKPYWLDVRDCKADPVYNVPGIAKKAKKKRRKGGGGKKASAAKRQGKGKKKGKKRRKKLRAPPVHTESRDYAFPESGRLIAGAGHVHGGAYGLTLTEPGCGGRKVAESVPTWGQVDHPFYNVRPILHEPGPINMTAFGDTFGLPVQAGEMIRLNSIYDNSLPHARVMGILVAYLAPEPVGAPCGPVPTWTVQGTSEPGRPGPIPFTIPLTGLDPSGEAITIKAPPGKLKNGSRNTITPVGDRFFDEPNLRLRKGSYLTWQFLGNELHNVTLANGPEGVGTDNLDGGRGATQKFTRPGTYRLFCALHPVQMQQRVVVTDKKKQKKKRGKRRKR